MGKELSQIIDEQEKSAGTSEVIEVLRIIAKSQDDLIRRCVAQDRRIEALIKDFAKGFPNEDPKAHREYHEKLIRAADATTQMMTELKYTIIKRGIIGAIYVIVFLVIVGLFSKDGAETIGTVFRWLVGKP